MAEGDIGERLAAGRDTVRRFQQGLARYAMPAEQRAALLEALGRFASPGEQLQGVIELMEAFGPPPAPDRGHAG